MKNTMNARVLVLLALFFVAGCTVNVQPKLNSSLGMDAFENMQTIDLHDVRVALYIEPELKKLTVNQKLKMGEFSFDVGNSFSVKFLKALSYNFRTIHLIDTQNYTGTDPVDAIIRINLQDVDMNMGVKTGFSTVSTETYTRLSIRAEIYDVTEMKTVWVGTTQAKEKGTHEEMGKMSYQEAGRGVASSVDTAVDKAIGDLINQMTKSQNLREYVAKWESKKG